MNDFNVFVVGGEEKENARSTMQLFDFSL